MQHWFTIGRLSDIPRRGARQVVLPRGPIAVFRTQTDEVYAIDDKCPHKGGPLSQGIVHDGAVTCPLHNWVIDLQTGGAMGADQRPHLVPGGRQGGFVETSQNQVGADLTHAKERITADVQIGVAVLDFL